MFNSHNMNNQNNSNNFISNKNKNKLTDNNSNNNNSSNSNNNNNNIHNKNKKKQNNTNKINNKNNNNITISKLWIFIGYHHETILCLCLFNLCNIWFVYFGWFMSNIEIKRKSEKIEMYRDVSQWLWHVHWLTFPCELFYIGCKVPKSKFTTKVILILSLYEDRFNFTYKRGSGKMYTKSVFWLL